MGFYLKHVLKSQVVRKAIPNISAFRLCDSTSMGLAIPTLLRKSKCHSPYLPLTNHSFHTLVPLHSLSFPFPFPFPIKLFSPPPLLIFFSIPSSIIFFSHFSTPFFLSLPFSSSFFSSPLPLFSFSSFCYLLLK